MPRPPSTEPRVRLNLEISVQVRERIDRIKVLTEADSTTEVVRRSLSVYETLLNLETGRLILRLPDGTEKDLILVP